MGPVDNLKTRPVDCGNFELICSLSANNVIPVQKYRSNQTGLTVIVAEVDGPLVNGYFCLATEAHDDDGLPHTLEHLIFLGSESYPYKGVLDLLANRCLASGTNAWTDTDHTCYTVNTAGSEGFLSLMPIYIDHILYPTLTDAGYITEVHHINGEGHDVGVVYCEMQSRENSGESRVHLELLRKIYPGKCGYKSDTGGIMKNLRESTSIEKVRAYHKEFYRPENLCIIIVGNIKPEEVLKALEPVEDKIIHKGPRGLFVRPWQDPVPPLPNSTEVSVAFPCDEEVSGMVYMGWRGPFATTQLYKMTACSILLKYLTDTPVSPLPKEFIDIPDPYASKVSYSIVENSESLLMLLFENVPTSKLGLVRKKLNEVFENIASAEPMFDMKRLKTVINRHRLECLTHIENSPHDSIAYMAIGHMLYGSSSEDLQHRINPVEEVEKLLLEEPKFWEDLFRTYLLEGKCVTVRGAPSIEEQVRMSKEEEERIAIRCKELGIEGLKKKEIELMEAALKNDIQPPEAMLTSVPIPSIEKIEFHKIKCYTSHSTIQHPAFKMEDVPVYVQLDHLQTNFVYMFALMDSSEVSPDLRDYLPLLMESIMESPVERDGVLIPYQDVISQLEEDTISAATRFGVESSSRFHCGPYSNTISLMLQLEPKKYKSGIKWIHDLLYNTKFTEERLKIVATKIVNNVAEVKRMGDKMVYDLMRGLTYSKGSNHYAVSVLHQYKFLTEVINKLEDPNKAGEVLGSLEVLRGILTRPSSLVIHMAANLDTLSSMYSEPSKAWKELLPPNFVPELRKLKVIFDWTLMVKPTENMDKSCVVGIGSVESNFLCQTSPGLKDFNDEDLAPLLVFFQYLTQLEGPMWKQIRGQGLAYSYNIVPRPHEAHVCFTLYRAGDVVGAYKEAKAVISNKLKSPEWNKTLFDSAKTSLIYEIIRREKSIGDVVAQSLLSYFKGVSHQYNKDLVFKINKVTEKDLLGIIPKYVEPMMDPKFCRTTVVCHPSNVEDVIQGLTANGLKLKGYNSLEESFLNDM